MEILFLDFSTRLESVDDLKTRARGGMVSSLVRVPDELSRLGHSVFVLSDIKSDQTTDAGTTWCSKDGNCWAKGHDWDFLVLNRGVHEGYSDITAKHRILWTHDLPHNGFIPEPKIMNSVSGVVFMSKYAERIWRAFFKTIGRSFQIPNGVDKTRFHDIHTKDLDFMVFGSAPNRGIKRLPLILDAINTRVKREMRLTAFSDIKTMHPNEAESNDFGSDYKEVEDSNVRLSKPLPQDEYAGALGIAGLMILPSDYPEICSNNVLQSLACGTPVITTGNLGATPEWVNNKNGYLTNFHVHDYMIHAVEIVRGAVKILENEKLHRKLIKNALKTKIHSWEEIGIKWDKMFMRLI